MRSFEEINADIRPAMRSNDVAALRDLAQELQSFRTDIADAHALNALGWADCVIGDYDSALERYNRAMNLHEKLGDRHGVASVTNNIGILYFQTGNFATALEHFRRALGMYVELGDLVKSASATGNIGNVYRSTGDYPSALTSYKRALSMYEEVHDRSGVALFTGNLGNLYRSTGDDVSALDHYRRAIAEYQELGNRAGVALFTGNMGALFLNAADYPLALEHMRRALDIYIELGDRAGIDRTTSNIVGVLLEQKAFDEAEEILDQQAAMPIENTAVRAEYTSHRARVSEHKGDLDGARDYLKEALHISTEAGLRDMSADFHKQLRDLAQQRNDFSGFVEHNAEYLRIIEEVQGRQVTQKMAMMEAERKAEAVESERVKERALLYGALPESVATRMLRGEDVSGDHYENVSILFMDIAGFTAISDRIPPGHVVHLLKAIFRVCDDVCKSHGLTKIKTIGDSYLAVAFPKAEDQLPASSEQQAMKQPVVAAARAAIEMMQKMNALELTMDPALGDTSWTQELGEIRVRIGLHCGPIVAGIVGDERLQYDVWGDTVNVASRMESTGEPGRIHISESFAHALKGADEHGLRSLVSGLRYRGETEVKGKGSMKTYWLEGA